MRIMLAPIRAFPGTGVRKTKREGEKEGGGEKEKEVGRRGRTKAVL